MDWLFEWIYFITLTNFFKSIFFKSLSHLSSQEIVGLVGG